MKACRICRDNPDFLPALPHEPRPIFQLGARAKICIASQAPGNKAHQKGLPFYDPSGVRLRQWLSMSEDEFYDKNKVAIIPMGFCFPRYDKNGGDLPPRKECQSIWHQNVFEHLPNLKLILTIGLYSQKYHLPELKNKKLTDIVRDWRNILNSSENPRVLPLPHPSWRNNAWLKRNPWFEKELLPVLQNEIRALIEH
jgi:uracil-DNA glycosylase